MPSVLNFEHRFMMSVIASQNNTASLHSETGSDLW
jgi:hypothetical protein